MCKLADNLIGSIDTKLNRNGYTHYSGIYKNGKIIFKGYNHLRNSYNNECICWSTHAEMDVLYKLIKSFKIFSLIGKLTNIINLNDYIIVVVRFGKDGSLKNSRPCNQCLETMIKYKIKKILYSNENGDIITEKPENMEKIHISSGWNAFSQL